jgi:tRNA(fMet)-specific endonuclease VapC
LGAAHELAVPVVAIGEFRYGITLSRHRVRYRRWLDALIRDARVLEIDERTTSYYAAIQVELRQAGQPIPTNDLWIAALCMQHGLPVLSRDRHFDLVSEIERLDW